MSSRGDLAQQRIEEPVLLASNLFSRTSRGEWVRLRRQGRHKFLSFKSLLHQRQASVRGHLCLLGVREQYLLSDMAPFVTRCALYGHSSLREPPAGQH